ncbi:MAG: DUF5916 domain-containing protein [Thermonemataceae bacterium]
MKVHLLCVILLIGVLHNGYAQSFDRANYQLSVKKTSQKLTLDGQLNEDFWQEAAVAKDFFQNFPFDTSAAIAQTEVRMAFDDQNIYIAATCYGQSPDEYVVASLRRDFDAGISDFFIAYIDTFQDGTNGFSFGVHPLGGKREGLLADGGNRGVDTDWDNRWFSKVYNTNEFWQVEMIIPLSSIRYKQGATKWYINFARADRHLNETSTWVPVPRNFGVASLGFTGAINFAEPLPKPKTNISLIPYLTGNYSRDFVTEGAADEYGWNVGGDAKIAVTSSLNLDLTFNPDFSQVEVDEQVTNLDRFEIFFPERRQFFLENADLFSRFGFTRIRPFFSRRIGISTDTVTGLIVQNPIIYGARLSGKVNRNWRVGLLNMQTDADRARGILGSNYTVAAVQRQVFKRSNIAGIFVNRQVTSDSLNDFTLNTNDYNRIVGLDYNLLSEDNKWNGKFFYHQMLSPEAKPDQYAHASFLRYSVPRWEIVWNHEYVGENYDPEVGFVPRRNHWRLEPSITHTIFPSNQVINRHRIGFYSNLYWDTEGTLTDQFLEASYRINFMNTSFFGIWFNTTFTKLFSDFDPTNTDGEVLLSGTEYNNEGLYIFYESDNRKLFTYSIGGGFESYFNGDRTSLEASVGYRFQPYGSITINAEYNRIELPTPYNSADFVLIGPQLDVSFTRTLYWTTFLQYNNQIENINLNTRLQWRFQPVSDIFIVYTDNYFPEQLQPKNRSLVVKMTYWLNL